MKRKYSALFIGLLFLGAGCVKTIKDVSLPNNVPPRAIVAAPTPQVVADADGGIETQGSMNAEKAAYAKEKSGAAQQQKAGAGSYKDYSVETVAAEQKAGKKVVLFFHAEWCPSCRAADAVFRASPEKFPAGYTVLKLDYDIETALKKKYGVIYQHTFVQIDNDGKPVSKWVSGDVDMLVKNVK